MSVINREDAITELMSILPKLDRGLIHWTGVKAMLEALPPAQSERKTGRCRKCAHAVCGSPYDGDDGWCLYAYAEEGENNDNSK